MSASLLAVQGLRSGYGAVEVLRGVTLEVGAGEIVALLGSNGAGKTTFNQTVSALVAAARGTGALRRPDITNAHYRDVVALGLIHVPEGRRIFPNLSVLENLELGSFARARGQPRPQPGAGVRHLPAPEGTHGQAGRHHERRRAADAGHRPRPDGRARAC
jgi:ABC-type branched-subunit amino acid transport system ATPase component